MIEITLTQETFAEKVKTMAEQRGIVITGHAGVIETMGVKAAYTFADGILTIKILDKPLFLTEEMCEKQLRAWL